MARHRRKSPDTDSNVVYAHSEIDKAEDFRLIFESCPHPYLIFRPDPPKFTIVAVNESYLAATGTRRSEIMGRGMFEVFPDNPDDTSATGVSDLRVSLERVVQEGVQDVMGVQKYDIPRRGEGETGFEVKYWSPINTPVFSQDGSVAYIIHRVEDVTEFILLRERSSEEMARSEKVQAKAEQVEAEVLRSSRELKEANRELKATKEELARLNEQLQELDRAKTAFFSNISHEFRTPLTLMLGPIEEALHDPGTIPENRVRMEVAHRNALRLLKLVNNLLDFSRIEAGRIQASYQPTDLSAFTAELASMFRSATEKAGLNLIVDCPPLPEPVYVDRDMWEKVLLNLLSNAFKHTFKGEIEVRLQWMGDHVEFTVRDTGVGIPAEQLPRLFERFYRVPNARSRTHEGSGIGLALVQELVKLHGGTIDVKSVIDQGTTFTISLPVGQDHLPADRIETESTLASTAVGAQPFVQEALRWLPDDGKIAEGDSSPSHDWMGHGRTRILLADDNADMRDYVYRLLTPYYDVEAVSDGEAALQAARKKRPDLILSDIMMPKLDGLGLLNALRQEETLSTVPIILLSARAGEEARIEGLQAGADDYLTKPFSAKELLARVKSNLELSRTRHEELIRQLEEQVKERTLQLETANKELEAFAYSVSHDLRAPLRAIDGFSQAVIELYSDKLDESGKELLQDIRQGSQKMGTLIDAMLTLSRLSRGQLTIEAGVNLSEMAEEIAHELQSQEPNRKVTFDIEPGIVATGDKRLLQSVLQNLLGNAWKYTAKHPTARIQFGKTKKDGILVYFVKDDGAGFNMKYVDKLFGAFQRLHNDTQFSGTGIGLATAARIIHRHGGQIWAEGAIEKGATFYFTLAPISINQENDNGRG